MLKVAIVGGGCSGVLSALALAKSLQGRLAITFFEPSQLLGQGLAYSTRDEQHLLNVPAIRMGAWGNAGEDFFDWLVSNNYKVARNEFVPRKWFGIYLSERLNEESFRRKEDLTISHSRTSIQEILRGASARWELRDSAGNPYESDAVILALGLPEPQWPPGTSGLEETMRCNPKVMVADSWSPDAFEGLTPDSRVLLLGTGLSAVDTVLSLKALGIRKPIQMLSRKGLIPRVHFSTSSDQSVSFPEPTSARLHDWVSAFRSSCEKSRWDTVIDAIRPNIPTIWQSFSIEERRRAIRHLQGTWDVHRHRMAPQVWEKIRMWIEDLWLVVDAGRLIEVKADGESITAFIRIRGDNECREERFDRIINCTGFGKFSHTSYHGLLGNLISHGYVTLDATGVGVNFNGISPYCIEEGLFIMGVLLRARRWESVAVPELRMQAQEIAMQVSQQLQQAHPS